jgi:hypothetical protein
MAAAATIAAGTALAPAPAQAGSNGGAVAAGVIGGLAAGALIGSAVAGPGYYGYGPGYYAYGAAPVYGPPCVWRRQRVWDGFGWRIQRVRVCY